MDQAIHFHDTEGARHVDTEHQGCSACGGDCPCPQACARREEAQQRERRPATGTWAQLFQWRRA